VSVRLRVKPSNKLSTASESDLRGGIVIATGIGSFGLPKRTGAPVVNFAMSLRYCHGGMALLPEGTITFMLTDLQGSTQAWEKKPKAMRNAMVRHDAILAGTISYHEGQRVEAGREGDSVLAVFRTAVTAAACALDIQRSFATESWPEGLELKVRVALHTGEAQLREGHYFGAALNRCARLLATCHPGQIVLTKATEAMLADEVPPEAALQDLGLHRLKDLSRPEQVFQLNDLGRPVEFPPIHSLPQLTGMPHYLTTFVGRSAELSALRSLLAQSRMVTLTGAGGSGKTRLAAELGQACLHLWSGGVWWVDLAPVDDARQVAEAVVTALKLPGQGPALEVAILWLAARKTILVLDNCEHLVAASAEFCQAALEHCPELTIIATSREALGVPGEVRRPVSSMRPTDAVQLFEARARLVRPDVKATSSSLETVTQICERLDGMPLAIELAAARMGMMTEGEILDQLSDRFRLLTGGSRTAPARQQTMAATIDWSYRLLTEDEALLFRRLSVFRGGFTLESAQAVCAEAIAGNVLDLIAGLVLKSMVMAERAQDVRSRYRLLESQLAYAEERSREKGELELTRRRHYEYFRDSLSANTVWQVGPRKADNSPTAAMVGLDWKAEESGNLWTALGWARNNADDLGLGLAVGLEYRDLTHARSVFADLLMHSPAQGVLRVKGLSHAAFFAWAQGDYEAAFEAAERSVAVARDVGDVDWLAFALTQLGTGHRIRGELAAAAEIYAEATALLKDSTNRGQLAIIRNQAGLIAIHKADYVGAFDILTECVASARADGDVIATANYLDSLARAQLGLNDHQAAAASWKEALSICRRVNDNFGTVGCLDGLSCAVSAGGDDQRALRLAAAANHMSTDLSLRSDDWLVSYAEESQRRSRSRLETRKGEQAWNQGWAMTVDQALDYALGGGEPDTLSEASALSRREREVATLVATGLTNRQIAKRLFIAERTAEGHVERIRNKLDVRSRTEVATWAVEHGLMAAPIKQRGTRPEPPSTQSRQPS